MSVSFRSISFRYSQGCPSNQVIKAHWPLGPTLSPTTDVPGQVRHTARSAALAQSAGLRALVTTVVDDAGPPSLVLNHALDKYNRGQTELTHDMSKTAFSLHHGGKLTSPWDFIENDGEGPRKGWRSRNFAVFINYVKEIFQLEDVLAKSHDWAGAGNTPESLGENRRRAAMLLSSSFCWRSSSSKSKDVSLLLTSEYRRLDALPSDDLRRSGLSA